MTSRLLGGADEILEILPRSQIKNNVLIDHDISLSHDETTWILKMITFVPIF